MACLHPILIHNRRYYNQPDDYIASQLILHPEDSVRLHLLVPCGHCAECLRAERNDWFIRLNREFEYQNSLKNPSWFITLTVAPKNYKMALESPSAYIRKYFEKIRHKYGSSVKHALFQEFGTKGGRLHFHGVLFGPNLRYRDLHDLSSEFGLTWLKPLTVYRCRYIVKYIVKDIDECRGDGRLLDKRYRRKFVSPGVGKYLGTFPAPVFGINTWSFTDFCTGRTFTYRIPRYYLLAFTSEQERRKRSCYSAFLLSQVTGTDFTSDLVREAMQEVFGDDWQRHVQPSSVRRALWSQKIQQSYFKRLKEITSDYSDCLSGISCTDSFLSFDSSPN